jgi:cytochrome b pre-mRNA-processing protein 3
MGILAFLGLKKYRNSIYELYEKIVAQARNENFYTVYGVPDTVNGRFDLITLHAFIIMRRLKDLGEEGGELSQDLFDVMFTDMDKNLREMGVGDLSVGKKIKALATAFYGRIKAYDEGIAGEDGASLPESLKRNLFIDTEPTDQQVQTIADYVMQEITASNNWSLADLKAPNISFGSIPEEDNE